MGVRKITDLEEIQLIALYASGFREEAKSMALELGVTRFYATVLCKKYMKPSSYKPQSSPRLLFKWQRAIDAGKISYP